jgi:Zn-dependent alcohol dehydrogenase
MVGVMGLEQTLSLSPPVVFGMSERKLIGCLLGSCNGRRDIPRLLDLWRARRLDLEAMITARRPLAEINEAMDDMTAGRGLRTVLTI